MAGDAPEAIFPVNDLEDYVRFRAAAAGKQRVLVLGAGLIGCEFANDLSLGSYGVELVTSQRAKALHPATEDGGLVGIELDSGATLRARTVVLAPGARWRQTGVPGEAEYRNKGVT